MSSRFGTGAGINRVCLGNCDNAPCRPMSVSPPFPARWMLVAKTR
jgi:hypothetical protein